MEKRNVNKKLVAFLLVFTAVLGYGLIGNAGNLEPSTGPASTMKTLDEVYAAASSAPTDDPVPDIVNVQNAKAIHMWLTGEAQGEIHGSCTVAGREDSIGVIGFEHSVISSRDEASGLPTGKRQHSPITITKRIDKSTPLIYRVLVSNENITDLTLRFYQDSRYGIVNYYTIELMNASIASIEQIDTERERISFCYQRITWTFEDGGITASDDWEQPIIRKDLL
jgi:type VI secretion system secreted protein Hcp